jgi:predicted CXXCH cytochrome family protein
VKSIGSKALLARVGLTAAFALGALLGATAASAGIATTKHNLSTSGTGGTTPSTPPTPPVHVTTGTDEICVFCHTPHGSDIAAPVPLWNKQLPTTSYQTYAQLNSSTIDGQILSVGSVSLACLSCHDGTQAMDNIINAPGSGGYQRNGGGAGGLDYVWTGVGTNVDATGRMINSVDVAGGTNIFNIGTDLRNDHPIGIQYCGGGPNSTTPTAACRDTDFRGPGVGAGGLRSGTINGGLFFWVDSGTTPDTRDKADMILFTRTFVGNDGAGPSVECATCHDPHQSVNPTFLRLANAGSAVCLACHVK